MKFPLLQLLRPRRGAPRPTPGVPHRVARAILVALLSLPVLAAAEPAPATRSFLAASPVALRGLGVGCDGGIQADDGSVDGAAGWSNSTTDGTYVMQFDLPSVPTRLDAVCLCFTRTEFANTDDLDFDVVVYAAGGPDGAPGARIASVPVRAVDVPDFFAGGVAMYRFDLGAAAPELLAQRVFVGAHWVPFDYRQFFLCSDASAGTPLNEGWTTGDSGENWERMSVVRPSYRAFVIRLFGSPIAVAPIPLPWAAAILLLLLPGLAWRRLRRPTKVTAA